MLKTFRIGGVHPAENKLSKGVAIEVMEIPKSVTIPLSQHIGAPSAAVVKKGDSVKVGQLIGSANGFVSANIHSSVSGTVSSVEMIPDSAGVKKLSVVIDVEGDEWLETIDRSSTLICQCDLSAKEIIKKITEAGIVGLGGATFPTQVKLSIPAGKKAEFLVVNAVECEPYLTSDDSIMIEHSAEIVVGIDILAKAIEVNKVYIGIENNKPESIKAMRAAIANYASMEVVSLKVQYPQGGEKQLIDAVARRQVPSGGLPIDVGAVVQNVGTALAVYEAVQKNKPLIERVVTVTGKGVKEPKNLLTRVGTPISMLIDCAGGVAEDTAKIIGGGPMMGRAIVLIDAPVTKGSSGILLMKEDESRREKQSPCISCAKCVSVCPMGLEPYVISPMAARGAFAQTQEYYVTDCIECGSCSYTCPAHIPLLDYIRQAKGEVMKIIRSRK